MSRLLIYRAFPPGRTDKEEQRRRPDGARGENVRRKRAESRLSLGATYEFRRVVKSGHVNLRARALGVVSGRVNLSARTFMMERERDFEKN